jgi:transposase-like protein
MEKRSRRKFSADFKTKVVLEALKEKSTLEEIARKYELHPNQIALWKKEFLSKAANVFASDDDKSVDKKQQDALVDKLYNQIGKQNVEIEWLKKKLQ